MNKFIILVVACFSVSTFAYRPQHRYHFINEMPDGGYNNQHNSRGREYGYSMKINHLTGMKRKPAIIKQHNVPHSYVSTYDSGSGYRHPNQINHNNFPTHSVSQHYMYYGMHPTSTKTTSTTTQPTTTRPTTTTTRPTTTRPTTTTTRATTTTTTTHKPQYHQHYFYFK